MNRVSKAKQATNSNRIKGSTLTRRELEVLAQLAQGKSNKDIAEALVISEATAINHLHSIFKKLRVRSRTEAVIYAFRHGIVEGVEEP